MDYELISEGMEIPKYQDFNYSTLNSTLTELEVERRRLRIENLVASMFPFPEQ